MEHYYFVTKTLSPGKGYSCVFRNWRANSHCNFLHGYDLVFQITFACAPDQLTKEGWVLDFAGLEPLKKQLDRHFDHKLLVARDDPDFDRIKDLHFAGIADVVEMERIGCEAFAAWFAQEAAEFLVDTGQYERVRVLNATVFEHDANAAGVGMLHARGA